VHHCDYPTATDGLIDADLETAMRVSRIVVNLGRGLRKRNDLRVRQPLSQVTVVSHDPVVRAAVESHRSLIREELNVRTVNVSDDETGLVVLSAKANFKVLGPRLGKRTREVAAHIEALDHITVAAILDGTSITIDDAVITADDLVVTRAAAEGMVVAAEGSISLAIDTNLTEDLLVEGTARELISRIQSMRREAGLAVTDRIALSWSSEDDRIGAAFDEHGGMIAGEVLAVDVIERADADGETVEVNWAAVTIAVRKVD